jgi:hypothetical protein
MFARHRGGQRRAVRAGRFRRVQPDAGCAAPASRADTCSPSCTRARMCARIAGISSAGSCGTAGWSTSSRSKASGASSSRKPARPWPVCTSHGHSYCGGALIVTAWVVAIAGDGTRSSPGSGIACSSPPPCQGTRAGRRAGPPGAVALPVLAICPCGSGLRLAAGRSDRRTTPGSPRPRPRHRPASSPTYRRNPHKGSRIVAVISAGCLLAPEPLLAADRNAGSAAGCAADLGGIVPAARRPRQLSGSRAPVSRRSLPVPTTAVDRDEPFNTARRP